MEKGREGREGAIKECKYKRREKERGYSGKARGKRERNKSGVREEEGGSIGRGEKEIGEEGKKLEGGRWEGKEGKLNG